MAKLRCKKCNHTWESSRIPKLCQFCGAEESLYEDGIDSRFVDVDELLK